MCENQEQFFWFSDISNEQRWRDCNGHFCSCNRLTPEFTHLCSLSGKPEAHHDQVKTDVDSRFGGSYTDMDHAVVAKEGSNGLIITIVHCCWLTIRRLQEGAVEFFAVQSITKEENIFDLPLLHYFPLKLWRCHAFRIFNLSTFPTNMWLSCDYAQWAHE